MVTKRLHWSKYETRHFAYNDKGEELGYLELERFADWLDKNKVKTWDLKLKAIRKFLDFRKNTMFKLHKPEVKKIPEVKSSDSSQS